MVTDTLGETLNDGTKPPDAPFPAHGTKPRGGRPRNERVARLMERDGLSRRTAFRVDRLMREAEANALAWAALSADERQARVAAMQPYDGNPRGIEGPTYAYYTGGSLALIVGGMAFPIDDWAA